MKHEVWVVLGLMISQKFVQAYDWLQLYPQSSYTTGVFAAQCTGTV